MQEVTCFHCRTVVQIAPDDDYCANCGEDLRGLISPEQVSDYFCERIAELSAAGRVEEALSEAERGLTYHDIADLHLLAAMLAEHAGRYDLMRSHVAAIPVVDSMRTEAEWLLRAHQERQRALREGAKHGRHSGKVAVKPIVVADLLGDPKPLPPPSRRGARLWTGLAALLIVVLLMATWVAGRQRGADIAAQSAAPDQAAGAEPAALQAAPPSTQPATELHSSAVAPAPQPAAQEAVGAPPAPVEPVQTERLLPVPTPSVPEDLVLQPAQAEAIADSSPRSVVVLSADGFDLDRVLVDSGLPELAELPIDARLQEGKLILTGLVHLDLQRRQMLEALESVPGITDVSTVNLLLRPKQTYVVQPGDTLWTIVYDIYGDVDRVEEFYLANIDIAPSPDALRVGDELRVPPIE